MLVPVVYPPHEPPAPPPLQAPPVPPEPSAPSPGEPPLPHGNVPWPLYLLRALWLCLFPVGIVWAGMLFLVLVPQAQEALLAVDLHSSQAPAFVFAFGLWLLLAWYSCRLLLDRRFKLDTLGECAQPRFALLLRRWLPRSLILIGGLPIAACVLPQRREWPIGLALLAVVLLLTLFAIKRRAWLSRLRPSSLLFRWLALESRAQAVAELQREDRLSHVSRGLIGLVLLLQWGVFTAVLLWPEATARLLGSPALVLLALGSWIVFGAVLLTYLPKVLIRVPLTPLPLLLFLIAAPINDNHVVAEPSLSAATPNAPRLGADVWLQQWLRGPGADGKRPLVLVAVAGGASRAAYWGSAALARLQTLAEEEGANFSDSVFAISGTSGGALGATTFVAALEARRQAEQPAQCQPWDITRAFTGQDHLATPVAMMLYPDLIQRLLPVPFESWDRSLGLEGVWTRDWERLRRSRCAPKQPNVTNPWREAFTALHARAPAGVWQPLLALNTSALARGQRVYQADYRLHGGDGIDLFDATLDIETDFLTLAQAVHNSARFPYISPAGTVKLRNAHFDSDHDDRGIVWDHLGDGGYVEASGALALVDLLRELEASQLLKDCKPEDDCSQVLDRRRLRVLLLGNTPAQAEDWLCRDAPRGNDIPPVDGRKRRAIDLSLPELAAPPVGVLASNGARAVDSQVELIKRVGGCGRVAELRLPRFKTRRDPSMNWMLNEESRRRIDDALQEKIQTEDPWGQAAQAQLAVHLKQARGWFLQMR